MRESDEAADTQLCQLGGQHPYRHQKDDVMDTTLPLEEGDDILVPIDLSFIPLENLVSLAEPLKNRIPRRYAYPVILNLPASPRTPIAE